MHAINKKQGIIQKLFGIAILTVDSGSTNTAYSAEITVIEKSTVVDELIDELKRRQAGKPAVSIGESEEPACPPAEKANLYSFTSKLKMIYSALNLCSTAFVFVILTVFGIAAFAFAAPHIVLDGELTYLDLLSGAVIF